MKRGELIYNYPLYSLKRLATFIKFCKPVARQIGGSKYLKILLDMLWCNLRYGAMDSRDYLLFEFHKKSSSERDSFFTKRRYFRLIKHFNKETLIALMEKDYMYSEYKSFIKRKWMLVNASTSDLEVKTFVSQHKSLLIKPVSAEQGNGIIKLDCDDLKTLQDLLNRKSTNPFLIEEFLRNCDDINLVNPYSLNTLRVYTIVQHNTKNPQVISASLRCGCGNTVVDNWGSGGVGYPIDLDLGIVCTYGRNKKGEKFAIHPGTDVQMIGFKIPFFKDALDFAIQCTKHNSNVVYAGVDIALTPNGPELVELNFPGGHDFLQTLDQVGKNSLMQSILKR